MKKVVLAILVLCSVGAVSVSAIADGNSQTGNINNCFMGIC